MLNVPRTAGLNYRKKKKTERREQTRKTKHWVLRVELIVLKRDFTRLRTIGLLAASQGPSFPVGLNEFVQHRLNLSENRKHDAKTGREPIG